MRTGKWVVISIALIALAVGGVLKFLFSDPRNGSIEYHKTEYLKRWSATDKWMDQHAPRVLRDIWLTRRAERVGFHYDALHALGYFEDRIFVVSNRSPRVMLLPRTELQPYLTNVTYQLTTVLSVASNTVTIRAPRQEMDELEKAVRRFDVPEK